MDNTLLKLPLLVDLETKPILKQLVQSRSVLAELKGQANTMPNKNVLINAIIFNEAKDSSEIENIITTHDELFKAISLANAPNPAAKEVANYRAALWHGFTLVEKNQFLSTNMIINIQQLIENRRAGIRMLPGTVLKDNATGAIVYTPPVGEVLIRDLLTNLEEYINDPGDELDPLIKMSVIHHQFESIHPFYDGNGRTGRIINVLYLVLKNLLDSPLLYLSKYIIRNKSTYYHLLQKVRTDNAWEEWVLFMLKGIEQTAAETLHLVSEINALVDRTTKDIEIALPKIYSKELMDLLFFEFYTKTVYIQNGLGVTRKTASGYLSELESAGFLSSEKIGRERVYLNRRLFEVVKKSGS